MSHIKLRNIGNSVGAIFPKEVLAKLRAGKGDSLYVTETPDGILLSTTDPEFENQMEAARTVMRKRRNVLRELAK